MLSINIISGPVIMSLSFQGQRITSSLGEEAVHGSTASWRSSLVIQDARLTRGRNELSPKAAWGYHSQLTTFFFTLFLLYCRELSKADATFTEHIAQLYWLRYLVGLGIYGPSQGWLLGWPYSQGFPAPVSCRAITPFYNIKISYRLRVWLLSTTVIVAGLETQTETSYGWPR